MKRKTFDKIVAMIFGIATGTYALTIFEMADNMDTSTAESFYWMCFVTTIFVAILSITGSYLLERIVFGIKRFIRIYKECLREQRSKEVKR